MDLERFKVYKIGIPEIDDEHFEMLTVLKATLAASTKDEVSSLLSKLADLWSKHSVTELSYMKKYNWRFVDVHTRDQLAIKIALEKCAEKSKEREPSAWELGDMFNLILRHYDSHDRAFSEFFNSQKV